MDLKYALGQKIDIPRTVLILANAAQWDVNLRNMPGSFADTRRK